MHSVDVDATHLTATQSPKPVAVVHEADERFRRAIDPAAVGAWCEDLRSHTLFVSAPCARMLGLSADERSTRFSELTVWRPDDRNRIEEAVRESMQHGDAFRVDARAVWNDGSEHWLQIRGRCVIDSDGAPVSIEGAVLDIAERKQIELALQESERRFEALISNLPGLAYRCRNDEHWTAEYVSEGVRSLTGYAPSDFTTRRVSYGDLVHPDDRAELWDTTQAALHERRPYQAIYRIVTSSGEIKWAWEHGQGRYSPQGDVLFLEGFVMDITERKLAEEQRKRSEAQLAQAQKMEALGRLAGGIAHDFNNVLAAIRGNASLAALDAAPHTPVGFSVREIEKAAKRAAELVRQILTFSRVTGPERQPIALKPVISEAVDLLRAALPASIEITSDVQSDVPHVLANATHIHQVVVNLVTNAAQAIGNAAGSINVKLALRRVDSTQELDLPAGSYACLSVIDSGGGMDRTTLDRMYEPFFTTKEPGRGTGLGLSVVHGIVRNHGGAIRVDSVPGRGARFDVYLPVTSLTPMQPPEKASPSLGRGERILYVDDEEALVSIHQRALQRVGYCVEAFVDPVQAIENFRARPFGFDLVITDYSMPSMSGRDLAGAVLAIRPEIPVLLTSGMLSAEDVQAAEEAGIRAVVSKPTGIDELCEAIDQALKARAQ